MNYRYEKMLPIVVISNLKSSQLTAVLGKRVIDRLKENFSHSTGKAGGGKEVHITRILRVRIMEKLIKELRQAILVWTPFSM
ncbi:MAG: hypothetical protein ACRENF_05685 [Thermodesulfobacteriota bacterium]